MPRRRAPAWPTTPPPAAEWRARRTSRPSRSAASEVAEPSPQLLAWEKTPGGQLLLPYLREVPQILAKEGIPETLVRIVVLPAEGDVARSILKYCQHHHVGIVVLGHSKPEGLWSFVQNSVTKTILSEFKNMAVWVVQRGTGSA